MTTQYLIAGDWGTSNLRLYLCELRQNQQARIIDTRFGPGISQINGDFEESFFTLVQIWLDTHGKLPVVLSGMVGSTLGWHEAPYLSCPVDAQQIANGRLSFSARGLDFSILCGLQTTNPLGLPDVMRGEELQLLGWMQKHQSDQHHESKQRLFVLPGTHNKWVLVNRGRVETFVTALSGELFGLLRKHSVLIADDDPVDLMPEAFMQGVQAVQQSGSANVIHTLFSVRSKQVLGHLDKRDALAYLSGMIVTADVLGALPMFTMSQSKQIDNVTIIGESTLSEQYAMVLGHLGIGAEQSDPADIAVTGYSLIHQTISQST